MSLKAEFNPTDLPGDLYDSVGARAIDRAAWIALGDVDGYRHMRRAALSALALCSDTWPTAAALHIVCGKGNNGGDGYALAADAHQRGISVVVYADDPPVSTEAAKAYAEFLSTGQSVQSLSSFAQSQIDGVVIDALLGTGLSRPADGSVAAVIDAINSTGLPVLSLDVPSGLNADTGHAPGAVVRATATLTFIVMKSGLLTGQGPGMTGHLVYDDLALCRDALDAATPTARTVPLPTDDFSRLRRDAHAHKGSHGHVLVIGGDCAMGGAALLASRAALLAGAGLVSLATRAAHVSASLATTPEVMATGVTVPADLQRLISRADVIAIGPGLGMQAW